MSFNPDDPKYTAYVLGELDDKERAAVDAELQTDSAVVAAVSELRTTTLRLSAALQSEPLPAISGATGSANVVPVGTAEPASKPSRKSARRLMSWKTAIGALAALAGCVLVASLLMPATQNAHESRRMIAANQMHQVGTDLMNYEDKRNVFSASAASTSYEQSQDRGGINGAFRAAYDRSASEPGTMKAGGLVAGKPADSFGVELSLQDSNSDTVTRWNSANSYTGATTVTAGTLTTNNVQQKYGFQGERSGLFANGLTDGTSKMALGTDSKHVYSPQGAMTSQPPADGPIAPSAVSGLDPAGQKAGGKVALGYPAAHDENGNASPDYLVERIVNQEPQVAELSRAMSQYKDRLNNAITTSRNPQQDPSVRSYRAQLESFQRQRDELVAELRPRITAQVQQMQNRPGAGGESEFNTESYAYLVDNRFLTAAENPLSTFSIDVDTASYSNIRRFLLQQNQLPPPGAVRIEEMINYFRYEYPQPAGDKPFSVTTEVASCPWTAEHRLVRIGLKGRELEHRPPSNLVFLIDVSGSMEMPSKLPLVQASLKMLTEQLGENDHVAIVVYAGNSGLVLPSTRGDKHEEIIGAIERLRAGGSTNGGQGIELAYEIACQNILKGGVNRVILATDGDFNVGITNQDALVRLIQDKAKTGVFLTTLGFGYGNLKDSTMQMLADKGNGNNYYIDDVAEARKVLVEQIGGTLVTIAKDVKLQIEFNPAEVAEYRLIGYEKRILAKEDFNDDKKDAGEIGAGHTVTALYEIVPLSGAANGPPTDKSDVESRQAESATAEVDPLKYQKPASLSEAAKTGELFTLKLRYKQPDGDKSTLMETPVKDAGTKYGQASPDFKFAAAVASFGMILRNSPYKGNATLAAVKELAQEGVGKADEKSDSTYRAEFVQLVEKAKSLAGPQ